MDAQVGVLTDFSAVLVPSALLDTEVERDRAQGVTHDN